VLLNKRFSMLFLFLVVVSVLFRLGLFLPFIPFYDLSYLLKDGLCSSIDALVLAVGSTLWFKKLFTEMSEASFLKLPDFYIVSGLNLYYFGTVLVFLMANAVYENNPKSLKEIWIFNLIMNIVFRVLLIVALFVQRKKQDSFFG
jgi:hypothetical protein